MTTSRYCAVRGYDSASLKPAGAVGTSFSGSASCPLGYWKAGRCVFKKEKCYCVDNGSRGVGVERCPVVSMICQMADGEFFEQDRAGRALDATARFKN